MKQYDFVIHSVKCNSFYIHILYLLTSRNTIYTIHCKLHKCLLHIFLAKKKITNFFFLKKYRELKQIFTIHIKNNVSGTQYFVFYTIFQVN